jgi:hypothetical protein
MCNKNSPPQFRFTVSLDTNSGVFTFYNSLGQLCDGSVTVTTSNTQIIYTLLYNSNSLIFVTPDIQGDSGSDLAFSFSDSNQRITIIDSDINNENVCLKLVVAKASDPSITFTSPDPQIRNRD